MGDYDKDSVCAAMLEEPLFWSVARSSKRKDPVGLERTNKQIHWIYLKLLCVSSVLPSVASVLTPVPSYSRFLILLNLFTDLNCLPELAEFL